MTSYISLRLEKKKNSADAGRAAAHWHREVVSHNVESERTPDNEILAGSGDLRADVAAAHAACDKPLRKDAVRWVEAVVFASPEWFEEGAPGAPETRENRVAAWRDRAMTWLGKEFGGDVVAAVAHHDEATPHIHAALVPRRRDKKGRLGVRAKAIMDGRQVLRGYQDRIAAEMADIGLNRGVAKTETGNEHLSPRQFRAKQRDLETKTRQRLHDADAEAQQAYTIADDARDSYVEAQQERDAAAKARATAARDREAAEADREAAGRTHAEAEKRWQHALRVEGEAQDALSGAEAAFAVLKDGAAAVLAGEASVVDDPHGAANALKMRFDRGGDGERQRRLQANWKNLPKTLQGPVLSSLGRLSEERDDLRDRRAELERREDALAAREAALEEVTRQEVHRWAARKQRERSRQAGRG